MKHVGDCLPSGLGIGRESDVTQNAPRPGGSAAGATTSPAKPKPSLPAGNLPALASLSTGKADRVLLGWLQPYATLRPVYSPNLNIHAPVRYEISGQRDEARELLEASLLPASPQVIERALTEMTLLLTKAKGEDPQTERMRAALYMERLSQYPADAVISVCRAWSDSNKFWPSWSELHERLEYRVAERRKMLDAVL